LKSRHDLLDDLTSGLAKLLVTTAVEIGVLVVVKAEEVQERARRRRCVGLAVLEVNGCRQKEAELPTADSSCA
jgi:hypothetical protein